MDCVGDLLLQVQRHILGAKDATHLNPAWINVKALLAEGFHIRQSRKPFRSQHAQTFQTVRLEERQRRAEVRHADIDVATKDRCDDVGGRLEGNPVELHTGLFFQHCHADVLHGPYGTKAADVDRTVVLFRQRNQVLQVCQGRVLGDEEHDGIFLCQRDPRKVAGCESALEVGQHPREVGDGIDAQCQAVGRRCADLGHLCSAAAAGCVNHNDGLTDDRLQFLGQRPRKHVNAATRFGVQDKVDRPAWLPGFLRSGRACQSDGQRGRTDQPEGCFLEGCESHA